MKTLMIEHASHFLGVCYDLVVVKVLQASVSMIMTPSFHVLLSCPFLVFFYWEAMVYSSQELEPWAFPDSKH